MPELESRTGPVRQPATVSDGCTTASGPSWIATQRTAPRLSSTRIHDTAAWQISHCPSYIAVTGKPACLVRWAGPGARTARAPSWRPDELQARRIGGLLSHG